MIEFHWWYIPLLLLVLILLFGKGKGGLVVKRHDARMEILDDRFSACRPDVSYCIFKEGTPDHIDIELENLSIPVADELDLFINNSKLATVKVKRNREAEFDHWSDEAISFPKISPGDELLVTYQGKRVMKGIFQ